MSKLTHKEHAARAMLMGLVYDWRDGTYCHIDQAGIALAGDLIDAETLDHITLHEANGRNVMGDRAEDVSWRTPPKQDTPWARMDDDPPSD